MIKYDFRQPESLEELKKFRDMYVNFLTQHLPKVDSAGARNLVHFLNEIRPPEARGFWSDEKDEPPASILGVTSDGEVVYALKGTFPAYFVGGLEWVRHLLDDQIRFADFVNGDRRRGGSNPDSELEQAAHDARVMLGRLEKV